MDFLQGRSRPVIIAHRGSSAVAPENTMAAFRRAVDEGAEMIELDVRMTLDDQLVVHHDRRLGRTSDGRGRIVGRSLGELRRLDAGGWFGRRFAGEGIPTLEEVLGWLPASIGLNVEVKTDGDRRGAEATAAAVLRVLRASGAFGRVLLSSFDHTFLQMAHSSTPRAAIGALVSYLPVSRPGLASIVRRTGASVLILPRRALRAALPARVHAAGMSLACYGIDTRAHVRAVRARSLDGMITNNPALLRRLLKEGV